MSKTVRLRVFRLNKTFCESLNGKFTELFHFPIIIINIMAFSFVMFDACNGVFIRFCLWTMTPPMLHPSYLGMGAPFSVDFFFSSTFEPNFWSSSSFLRCLQSCSWLFRHFRGWSQNKKQKVLKLLHHLKFLLKNKTPSWLVSGRWLRQKCQQSSPLLHPWSWRESSSPWWCTVKRNHLCTVFWWWWGISCWQCWATYIYKCLLTPLVGLSSRLRFCLLAFLLRVQGNRLQNKLLHHFCFYFCCIIIIQIYSHGLSGQTVSANLAAH